MKIMSEEKSSIDLLDDIENEFDKYASTLESDDKFRAACDKLRKRLQKIEKS